LSTRRNGLADQWSCSAFEGPPDAPTAFGLLTRFAPLDACLYMDVFGCNPPTAEFSCEPAVRPGSMDAQPAVKKRKPIPAARKRLAEANKKRWTAFRAAKATPAEKAVRQLHRAPFPAKIHLKLRSPGEAP
jgi:hypothetical protein